MIIKEYTYNILDKYNNKILVSAKIEKKNGCYYWTTSHLTKPQDAEGIGLYRPSNMVSTFVEAKSSLTAYINTMKCSKVVEPNEYY